MKHVRATKKKCKDMESIESIFYKKRAEGLARGFRPLEVPAAAAAPKAAAPQPSAPKVDTSHWPAGQSNYFEIKRFRVI